MKKLLLSIVIVSVLLAEAFLLPTIASAHATTANNYSTFSCTYTLTPVSNTVTQIVVHFNDCLAQSLGTIGVQPLTTLLVKTGIRPGIAGLMARVIIANQGLIQGVDLSCFGTGANVGYDPILGIIIDAVCS